MPHLTLIKWMLYVKGTLFVGLHIDVGPDASLIAYSDPCQASVSSLETIWFLGLCQVPNLQMKAFFSIMGTECCTIAHIVVKCCWLQQLLWKLHI